MNNQCIYLILLQVLVLSILPRSFWELNRQMGVNIAICVQASASCPSATVTWQLDNVTPQWAHVVIYRLSGWVIAGKIICWNRRIYKGAKWLLWVPNWGGVDFGLIDFGCGCGLIIENMSWMTIDYMFLLDHITYVDHINCVFFSI